jgi:hypothetical protein
MLQLLTIWSHRKSMFFDFKMRSMRKIKSLKKRLSNVYHQSKMRNMWRISWCSKKKLSHTLTKDEKDEIDENQRNFILFCQVNVDQTRCHALFVIFRKSFFIQQYKKKRTSRVSKRFSKRFSKQNLVFRNNIIRISIRIRFVSLRCYFRRRFRCCFRLWWFLRWHFRRCFHTTFCDFFHDLVNKSKLTNNNDANERIKSTNNHFIQRRLAIRLINHEIQTQIDRHVLKRRSHIHEFSTRFEQKSLQIHEANSDYSNRDNQSQKSKNSRKINRISDFSEFRNDTYVANSDTEARLRQNHVMWLQSRDVAKVAVYRAG